MAGVKVDLTGDKKLQKKLRELGNRINPGAMRILSEEHETIMTEAKVRTPVDTGNLRDSGFVQPSRIKGREVVSEGGFGGPAVDYALAVHENLRQVVFKVGRSKFYESALLEAVPGMNRRIGRELWAEIKRLARRGGV